jgi:phosphoenolpyruvate carboxykinase (GTP)
LKTSRREGAQLPKIFHVNWFRKDEGGKFLWPGYGENSRVLAWIFRRCEGSVEADETPIGLVPKVGDGGIETEGLLDVSPEAMSQLVAVDLDEWRAQLPQMREHYAKFGDALPAELREQLQALEKRLG